MKKGLSEPLDDEEFTQLDEFLLNRIDAEASDRIAAAGGDEGILDVLELDGFLTALVSSPNVIVPSRWLPAMWGVEGARAKGTAIRTRSARLTEGRATIRVRAVAGVIGAPEETNFELFG